jgi:serine/threonine protein kinase
MEQESSSLLIEMNPSSFEQHVAAVRHHRHYRHQEQEQEQEQGLPDRIGPYKPLRRIGAGGMGTVYFAYHPATGAPTAVKALRTDHATDASYRARFTREVTVLRRVSGPYLVPLIDADAHGGLPWLAMPYVPGNTLHQHIETHGPLRGSNLFTFAAAVAHALSCIHMAGVIHRDLKPTNVILAADGPRVVDFGIADHLDATAITATSISLGTPGWMAPEQLTRGITTPACDIFAWGLLIAYAAAGTNPFGTPAAIHHRIIHAEPDLSAVPDRLRPLVAAALEKDPQLRLAATDLAEQATALQGPNGTAIFPTATIEDPAEQPTAILDTSQWDVPEADTDLTRILPFVPAGDWLSGQPARDLLENSRTTLKSAQEAIHLRTKTYGLELTPIQTAVDAARAELAKVQAEFDRGGWPDTAELIRSINTITALFAMVTAVFESGARNSGGY